VPTLVIVEILDSFMFLGSNTNTKNYKIMEIRVMLMANKAYFSTTYLFKSRTINRTNRIRKCKTAMRAILCCMCETYTMINKAK
jgi:hypothetical protein